MLQIRNGRTGRMVAGQTEDTVETETECTTHNHAPTNMEMESLSAFVLVMLFL